MKTVCEINACAGCKVCMNICSRDAIRIVDTMKNVNAVIDENICVNCGLCVKVCPNNVTPQMRRQISWNQGWAKDESLRRNGASGGVASSLIASFIKNGGYVCSCLFDNGEFVFMHTDNPKQAKRFAGSKYVKSDPGYIYRTVKRLLSDDKKVLFIGLPCQVAAVNNYIPSPLQENLYTVDLICHGTPSMKLFELYLKQNDVTLKDVVNVKFRQNTTMGLLLDGKSLSEPGMVDRYLISFLNALNYTEHCYQCQYATIERLGDLTLGDSWGTNMAAELSKGVSLISCQTEKGKALLHTASLNLYEVEIDNALAHNGNLQHPSVAPLCREMFFEKLLKGANYNKLIMKCFPKQCLRQSIKGIAIKLKFLKTRRT